MKTRKLTLAALFVTLSATGAMALEANLVVPIGEFSCRDMLVRSGFERDFTMAFMHGYMSGKLNELEFNAPELTEATDAVLDFCINNPGEPLMAAFVAARG
ncbi:HdeA/HdeB family chaperone [Tropicimonas sp. TH_r6]|uniref:HdeA/HdeB family chaperone n=1 Tax=Tropicimonas sp. TH_r6 TaxID=3082085 RepID=UPI0029548CCD|nr:HdeA/HdeB family chaperone [Tropicimonas sp. TH_r6]MDV7145810.1 HdeA/HdeB family chaperone [Tropicimonas sp. TH_r6]